MQLTPGQLRTAIGLSVESYRHWKRVLPPFVARKRYAPSFSLGDALAASILRRLVDIGGMRVGHLKKASAEIVALCNGLPWAKLTGRTLIVDVPNGACHLVKHQSDIKYEDLVIVCPLAPIMTELSDRLRRVQPSLPQRHLPFLPATVETRPEMQRGRT